MLDVCFAFCRKRTVYGVRRETVHQEEIFASSSELTIISVRNTVR